MRDFYIALDDAVVEGKIQKKIPQIIAKYIAASYIQHQQGGKDGRAAMSSVAIRNSKSIAHKS